MAMHAIAIDEMPRPVTAAPEGDRVAVRYALPNGGGEGALMLPAQVARVLAGELVLAAAAIERRDRARPAAARTRARGW